MRRRTIYNGVRVNLEFYSRHELLTFRTWCFLRKKSMREMILEWLEDHRKELMINWEKAQRGEPLDKIEPLK